MSDTSIFWGMLHSLKHGSISYWEEMVHLWRCSGACNGMVMLLFFANGDVDAVLVQVQMVLQIRLVLGDCNLASHMVGGEVDKNPLQFLLVRHSCQEDTLWVKGISDSIFYLQHSSPLNQHKHEVINVLQLGTSQTCELHNAHVWFCNNQCIYLVSLSWQMLIVEPMSYMGPLKKLKVKYTVKNHFWTR